MEDREGERGKKTNWERGVCKGREREGKSYDEILQNPGRRVIVFLIEK